MEFGWSSSATARDHLRALARKGHVELPGSPGGRVRLCDVARTKSIPVIGRIAAGIPSLAEQDIEGLLPIPADWALRGDFFALRVVGDSMKDAGILEGDHVVLRKEAATATGEIVAATIDGETTLKRLVKRGKGTFLVPENSSYEPIEVKTEAAVMHGVVVALLRSYRHEGVWRRFSQHAGSRDRRGGRDAHRA